MSVQGHLEELKRRHRSLERQIEIELVRPSSSDQHLQELKRKKLLLKDESSKLQNGKAVLAV